MSCVMRVDGDDFDIDGWLAMHDWEVLRIRRKGEPCRPGKPNGPMNQRSSVNIDVSRREFSDFEGQLEDTYRFLEKNRSALEKSKSFPGLEGITLDFGVEIPLQGIRSFRIAPSLLTLAGELGIAIELTAYPATED